MIVDIVFLAVVLLAAGVILWFASGAVETFEGLLERVRREVDA